MEIKKMDMKNVKHEKVHGTQKQGKTKKKNQLHSFIFYAIRPM